MEDEMTDLSDERLEELTKWAGGYGMPDVSQLLAELQRHRATRAADAERIKAVVRAVITNDFPFTDTDKLNIVAGGVAEKLAIAAVTVNDDRIHGEVEMLRDLGVRGASVATYGVLVGALRAAYGITHVQANGEPSDEDVLDVLLRALASVPPIALAARRSQP